MSLTALNGPQKRHILADKQEHSSSPTAVLTRHILAESAKIGHNLAGSTKSVAGFDRPVEHSKHGTSSENACLKEDLSGKFRLGSNPKTAITAFSAIYAMSVTSFTTFHSSIPDVERFFPDIEASIPRIQIKFPPLRAKSVHP